MPIIKLSITKSNKEWAIIEKAVEEKFKGKKPANGTLINSYIRHEIQKNFSLSHEPAAGIKVNRVRKCFTIKIDDHIFACLQRTANELGLDPAEFITAITLNPHITIASLLAKPM